MVKRSKKKAGLAEHEAYFEKQNNFVSIEVVWTKFESHYFPPYLDVFF